MKELINNQKIGIDQHSAAAAVKGDLKSVHLHKTFLGGKRRGRWIKIYLKGDNIDYDSRLNAKERVAIKSEIRKRLNKDGQRLEEFAKYAADNLGRWSNGTITIDAARSYARGIAERFELKPDIIGEYVNLVENKLASYLSLHLDPLNNRYTISQNDKDISIQPGEFKTKIIIVKGKPAK